jgi:hypothetical protein
MLIGRRVPFTRFIPFFSQLAPRASLIALYERTARFFATLDPGEARAIAQELGAKTCCWSEERTCCSRSAGRWSCSTAGRERRSTGLFRLLHLLHADLQRAEELLVERRSS